MKFRRKFKEHPDPEKDRKKEEGRNKSKRGENLRQLKKRRERKKLTPGRDGVRLAVYSS